MELLKLTDNGKYINKPWGGGKGKSDIEYLRDRCLLNINDELEWTFYLNGETATGNTIYELRKLINEIVEKKEKSHRSKDKNRRLVIWTSRLTLFHAYIRLLYNGLELSLMEKFRKGRYEKCVMDITNPHLEFRNFEEISGETIEEVNKTYSFNCDNEIDIMNAFIDMRFEEGLNDWKQLRYTFANNSLKLFYREANFSEKTLRAMKYESLERKPSLPLSQIYDVSCKAGVMFCQENNIGIMKHNVKAKDINEAYNAQFVRGDDFPIDNIRKVKVSELASLIREDKWFLVVMESDYEIKSMPRFLSPYQKDEKFYYIIEQYDYKCLTAMGLKITTIDKNWRKYKLFKCDKVGYLHWNFRKHIVKRYGKRRYLKRQADPKEKTIKQQFKVVYGKGLQKRNFKTNSEIANYYRNNNTYINQIVSYHAMARNRLEIIIMLNRLNLNFESCDTDGIKTLHPDADQIFEQRNQEIREENARAGFINTEIGLWKDEGCYPNFIQFGNKVYAYEENGVIVCKFAGCLKSAWKEYFGSMSLEEGLERLKDFNLKIPNGCVRRSLVKNENGELYIRKRVYFYGINGTDVEAEEDL